MAKVLLVDDDPDIALLAAKTLEQDGAICDVADSFDMAQEMITAYPYELLVLDLGLPDGSGAELCNIFLKKNRSSPILILSGESSAQVKVALFGLGAQDYLTKPFSPAELRARARSLMRRFEPSKNDEIIECGALRLSIKDMTAIYGKLNLDLGNKEFAALHYFVANPDRIVTHGELLATCWNGGDQSRMSALRVHICRLRNTIKQATSGKMDIETVPRMGYRFRSSSLCGQ